MLTVSDIPALRQMILSNANLLYRSQGLASWTNGNPSSKMEVVIASAKDSKTYVASLIDGSSGKVLLSGPEDANPAVAVNHLFDLSADQTAKIMNEGNEQDQTQKK